MAIIVREWSGSSAISIKSYRQNNGGEAGAWEFAYARLRRLRVKNPLGIDRVTIDKRERGKLHEVFSRKTAQTSGNRTKTTRRLGKTP